MKTIRFIATILVCTAFVACNQNLPEREPSPADDNSVQAYVFENTADVLIKPIGGDTVEITYGGGSFQTTATPSFPVLFGRNNATDSITIDLIVAGDVEAFDLENTVSFAPGESVDTLWVTPLFSYGESATLEFAIPEGMTTSYGKSAVSIKVSADYTWLPAGSVTFSSDLEGATGTISIEKAKEYTPADSSKLYRLNSPYFIVAPEYCTTAGYHLMFYLDKEYKALGLNPGFNQLENSGYSDYIYWDLDNYSDAESFSSVENTYTLTALWSDGSGLYGPYVETWTWTDGFPGDLSDPTEGDGEWKEIVFTKANMVEKEGGVHEVLDLLAYEQKDDYGNPVGPILFPDSYLEHSIYTLVLTNAQGGTMQLQLVGDELAGEYTIGSLEVGVWGVPVSAPGVAVTGYTESGADYGCVIDLTWNKFFLVDGTIVVSATETGYQVTVEATSASGLEVKASFDGVILTTPLPEGKAARKIAKL